MWLYYRKDRKIVILDYIRFDKFTITLYYLITENENRILTRGKNDGLVRCLEYNFPVSAQTQ